MALNYITSSDGDFGGGIDMQSAETAVPPGFVEDLLNLNPQPEGYLSKRKGYQGYAGFLPIRVTKVEQTTVPNELCFYLDSTSGSSSIDLSSIRNTPIVVYGRTSNASTGDFTTTDIARYYPSFTTDIRRTFSTGLNTITVLAAEHGFATPNLFVTALASNSTTDNSNTLFILDSVSINKTTFAITITYTNNTGSSFQGYLAIQDKSAVSGTTYVHSTVTVASGVTTATAITAVTHGLNNFNILVRAFEDDGTSLIEVIPDTVTIGTTGTITVTVTNNSGTSKDYRYILTSVATINSVTGSVASGSSMAVSIINISSDFVIVKAYLEVTIGGTKEEVIPDSVVTDVSISQTTITFTNNGASAANFFVFYEYASISSNKLCVTPYTSGTTSDTTPQLTLWGLNHDEIYGPDKDETRAGWVNHIDAYRSVGENRLVSGLGGNIFSAEDRDSVGTAYLLPLLYPNLRTRIFTSRVIGPAFVDTAATSSRTRGYIKCDGAGDGLVQATETQYDSGTGWVRYTLACPNLSIVGTLSTIISATTDLEDSLYITQSGWAVNSGSFKIRQITNPSANILYVWVENDAITSSDYDESDAGMQAGVFTDRLTVITSLRLSIGDRLLSDLFTEAEEFTITKALGSTIVFDGVTEELSVPAGLRVVGRRSNSRVIPMRDLLEIASVTNLVVGDMLTLTDMSRQLRVKSINTNGNETISIDGDGNTATATVSDTSTLAVGQYILLVTAGEYTGEHVITSIPSTTTFTFDSTGTTLGQSAVLGGKNVEIDEAIEWEDTVNSTISYTVSKRWIPVEAPDDSYGLTPSTYISHFSSNDYDAQPFLRSVMVADNMYFTNGEDSVTKYDGVNIYRAGLPRWQPQLFVTTDTAPATGGEISVTLPSATPTVAAGSDFTVEAKDAAKFSVGDFINQTVAGTSYRYLIIAISEKDNSTPANIKITVDRPLSPASTNAFSKDVIYKYYFKLNAVDANNNIIATAPTGSEDFRVALSESAQVRIKVVGLPAWDIYDYDRLEVQIYRTKANQQAPFYLLTTLPMQFDNGNGYIIYNDAAADDTLLTEELDKVSTSLTGAELGLGWTPPLRANYITTAGNSLILGNITGFPELNISLVDTGTNITNAVLNNKTFTFRKSNTNTGTVTDMLNVAKYEFLTASTGAVSTISSTASAFTVTTGAAHGLAVGDWVYLFRNAASGTTGLSVNFNGWHQVKTTPTGTTFTVSSTLNRAFVAAQDVDSWVKATDSRNIPVYLGTDRGLGMKNGNRSALVDFDTVDTAAPFEFFAVRRLASAINSTMRVTDTSITAFSTFVPWIIAEAGSEYASGQLIIKQPKTLDDVFEVVLPTYTGFNIFANGILRSSAAEVSAQTLLFPSRILISYQNYPEIFDSPTVTIDIDSDSAVDVNPADGQQITAIIPFFGDSAFGTSLKNSVVVVFKTNSIYLVNLAAKAAGESPVQKVESRGLGCTAPYSVSVTRDAIMFANESGIYQLTRSLAVEYVGQKLDRLWNESVNRDEDTGLLLMQGHHYPLERQYKLSVPYAEDTALGNSHVAVYNHTREYKGGMGSWTIYDTHPATGWANLQNDAFMATMRGQVFSIRRALDNTDYRDDAAAIACEGTLRATDFGDSGIRKAIQYVSLHFRNVGEENNTSLSSAIDLVDNFVEADAVKLFASQQNTNLSDDARLKVQSIRFTIDDRKGRFIQLKVANDGYDEGMELTKVDYRVGGLSAKGTTEAADTTR